MKIEDMEVLKKEDNTVAVISYLTIIGFLVAVILYQNKRTALGAFHLREMLGLIIFSIGLYVVALIPVIGMLAFLGQLALFVFWLLGLINAINREMKPLPLIGDLFQRWFANTF